MIERPLRVENRGALEKRLYRRNISLCSVAASSFEASGQPDPVAAFLLFARPKVGIVSTVVLIGTNVIHNLAVTAHYAPEGEFLTRAANFFLISQIGFMLFVAATARIAWRGAQRSRHLQSS